MLVPFFPPQPHPQPPLPFVFPFEWQPHPQFGAHEQLVVVARRRTVLARASRSS